MLGVEAVLRDDDLVDFDGGLLPDDELGFLLELLEEDESPDLFDRNDFLSTISGTGNGGRWRELESAG